jgi:hypothetical protein
MAITIHIKRNALLFSQPQIIATDVEIVPLFWRFLTIYHITIKNMNLRLSKNKINQPKESLVTSYDLIALLSIIDIFL